MDTQNALDTNTQVLAAHFKLLQAHLKDAADRSAAAYERIGHGDRNGALGCIANLDTLLTEAKAVYDAAVALDRTAPTAETLNSLENIRRRYPSMTLWISPGGCCSLRHPCEDGGYLSIADPFDELEEKYLIDSTQAVETIEVERYGANDEIVERASLPVEKVCEWIEAALCSACTPKDVPDHS